MVAVFGFPGAQEIIHHFPENKARFLSVILPIPQGFDANSQLGGQLVASLSHLDSPQSNLITDVLGGFEC